MDPIFTLQYPEYQIALDLQDKYFKKNDGYSILIPLSRQQEGFDLIIYSKKTKKTASIQVKSSQSYGRKYKKAYEHYFWFNKFKYKLGKNADFFMFFCLYPKRNNNRKLSPYKLWNYQIITFEDRAMHNLFSKLAKSENGICFYFNSGDEKVLSDSGEDDEQEYTEHLLKSQINILKEYLK